MRSRGQFTVQGTGGEAVQVTAIWHSPISRERSRIVCSAFEAAQAPRSRRDRCRARLVGAIDRLSAEDVERVMVQVEALGRHGGRVGVRDGHVARLGEVIEQRVPTRLLGRPSSLNVRCSENIGHSGFWSVLLFLTPSGPSIWCRNPSLPRYRSPIRQPGQSRSKKPARWVGPASERTPPCTASLPAPAASPKRP